MSKSAVITARVAPELLESLDALAALQERTRGWLIAKAIGRFVHEEQELHAFLKEGEDAIDRGDYLTQEEMVAEIAAWKHDRTRAA